MSKAKQPEYYINDALIEETLRTLISQVIHLRYVVIGGDYASNDEIDSVIAKLDALHISDKDKPEGEV